VQADFWQKKKKEKIVEVEVEKYRGTFNGNNEPKSERAV
jgi:hypothetical protein